MPLKAMGLCPSGNNAPETYARAERKSLTSTPKVNKTERKLFQFPGCLQRDPALFIQHFTLQLLADLLKTQASISRELLTQWVMTSLTEKGNNFFTEREKKNTRPNYTHRRKVSGTKC